MTTAQRYAILRENDRGVKRVIYRVESYGKARNVVLTLRKLRPDAVITCEPIKTPKKRSN